MSEEKKEKEMPSPEVESGTNQPQSTKESGIPNIFRKSKSKGTKDKQESKARPGGKPEAADLKSNAVADEEAGKNDPVAAELARTRDELASALIQNVDLTDKYMRTLAEFDNFKKRSIRDMQRSIELETEKLIMNILPVMDDFDRAFRHGSTLSDASKVLDGFNLVKQKFLQTLKGFDIQPFDSVGEEFDPERHDALMTRTVETDEENDRVLEEFEKGFLRSDRVIRHARVVVGKKD